MRQLPTGEALLEYRIKSDLELVSDSLVSKASSWGIVPDGQLQSRLSPTACGVASSVLSKEGSSSRVVVSA